MMTMGVIPVLETARNRCWHRVRAVGAPLKPREINRRNERVRAGSGRKTGCVHTVTRVTSGSEQLRYTHTHTGEGTYEIPLHRLPNDGRDRLVTMTLRMKGTAEVG